VKRRIRVVINIDSDDAPGPTAERVRRLIEYYGITVDSLTAKEVRPVGRAPVAEPTRQSVVRSRQAGMTHVAIARKTGLSRSSVIRICKKSA